MFRDILCLPGPLISIVGLLYLQWHKGYIFKGSYGYHDCCRRPYFAPRTQKSIQDIQHKLNWLLNNIIYWILFIEVSNGTVAFPEVNLTVWRHLTDTRPPTPDIFVQFSIIKSKTVHRVAIHIHRRNLMLLLHLVVAWKGLRSISRCDSCSSTINSLRNEVIKH